MTVVAQGARPMSRRGFLYGVAALLVYGAVKALSVPNVGEVTIPNQAGASAPHSVIRHGRDEVNTVHRAMIALAATNAWFFKQPPCKDGRYRFIAALPGGEWAVWVLESAGAALQEVTAFVTDKQDYVRSVRDECGNGSWFGHNYAG